MCGTPKILCRNDQALANFQFFEFCKRSKSLRDIRATLSVCGPKWEISIPGDEPIKSKFSLFFMKNVRQKYNQFFIKSSANPVILVFAGLYYQILKKIKRAMLSPGGKSPLKLLILDSIELCNRPS